VENRQTDDQKRVVTVEQAFQDGADYIVLGRPIQNADNPRKAAELIQESISNSL
jgi:Orotidine-5''-phosphate decarboxylase